MDDMYHFKAGLEAMLYTLEPDTVLVYGSMPEAIKTKKTSSMQYLATSLKMTTAILSTNSRLSSSVPAETVLSPASSTISTGRISHSPLTARPRLPVPA